MGVEVPVRAKHRTQTSKTTHMHDLHTHVQSLHGGATGHKCNCNEAPPSDSKAAPSNFLCSPRRRSLCPRPQPPTAENPALLQKLTHGLHFKGRFCRQGSPSSFRKDSQRPFAHLSGAWFSLVQVQGHRRCEVDLRKQKGNSDKPGNQREEQNSN